MLASFLLIVFALSFLMGTAKARAATESDLTVGGWIPYWQDTMGTKDADKHLSDLDTVYPFVFSVKQDGTLADLGDLDESGWKNLLRDARRDDVEIIPTVMWSDGAQIQAVLSDADKRADHIDAIADMVDDGDFDGVNIDYEGKLSATKDYFSTFLKELKHELGNKTLTCTVEPRTPPESLYRTVPADLASANDYAAIGTYCDRVEIMAYDQRRADLLLDDARKGEPYVPVADPAWVEKVIELALKDIPADKIILGVPTYGQRYTVMVAPQWYSDYVRIGSLNLPDANSLARDAGVEAGRNAAGEMSFSFFPDDSIYKILNQLPTPAGTRTGFEAAMKALTFANATGMTVPVDLVWYSDAGAVKDKMDLAEKYGLRGIALFKIDGEEDSKIWSLF
jgi:spore germination protein YaaH